MMTWMPVTTVPPQPVEQQETATCRHCGTIIHLRKWMGYRFWCDNTRGDICSANPLNLRPFGGEHEPEALKWDSTTT